MIHFEAPMVRTYLLKGSGAAMLACSGGVDSIAGSHFLITHLRKKVEFSILHVNNRLLPTDDEACDKVHEYAKMMDVNMIAMSGPVSIDVIKQRGIESACREARLKVYKSIGGTFVLFHHLDDAVESHLMNAMRGKTCREPLSRISPLWTGTNGVGTIIRPFVSCTQKRDFSTYARQNDLMQWVTEDPLNAASRRGWIRSTLLPVVSQQYPGLVTTVRKMYRSNDLGPRSL